MADRTGYTKKETDWLGREKEVHYDNDGSKVGETRSTEDWLGSPKQEHYDADGEKTGETRRGSDWLGNDRAEHFDSSGEHVGWSRNETNWIGEPIQRHYDASREQVGSTTHEKDWLGQPRKDHTGRNPKAASEDHAVRNSRQSAGARIGTSSATAANGSGSGLSVVALCFVFILAYFLFDAASRNGEPLSTHSPNGSVVPIPIDWGSPQKLWLKGIGSIRIGMNYEEVAVLSGGLYREPMQNDSCFFAQPPSAPSGINLMFSEGTLARIDVTTSAFTTLSGARVGQAQEEVLALYPQQLLDEPHKYGENWRYLTLMPKDATDSYFRVVFETDGTNLIRFRSGRTPEVEYVEGCL